MRLFVAFNLPARQRKEIHQRAGRLRERELPVRWVPPENYHVTLKFLGKVDGDRVDSVVDAVASVARGTDPFDVDLSGFGAFPTIRKPRVLWLGVDASPELRCLKQDLEWAMADRDFDRDARAFHPHVTLGRAEERGGAGAFRGLDQVVAGMDYTATVPFQTLDLMKSTLGKGGPRYSVMSSTPLGASD